MKTVLFATTALVASTTFAVADVTLSGSAEMGIFGTDLFEDNGDDDDDTEVEFHTDIDVTFTMSGATDTGLTFGANIDLDESDGSARSCPGLDLTFEELDTNNDGAFTADDDPQGLEDCDTAGNSPAFDNDTQGGESIFISGAFGTLTMGDTDGAFDWALQEAIIGSAINDDHEHGGYNGNSGLDGTYDGQIARYEYAFQDFAIALSGEIDDDEEGDPVLGAGVRYATEFGGFGLLGGNGIDLSVAAGVQTINGIEDIADDVFDDEDTDDDDATIWGVSADVELGGGFRVIGNYSDLDDIGGFENHWGVAVGYSFDAFTVAANYGEFDGNGGDDAEGWGVVANYDLGGGAELQAGYGFNEVGGDDFDTYSFGISMSF